jgi:pyruvate dehydrogenase kinase 2/3/4
MKRWTLRSLANLKINSSTAETVLQHVADRLAWQQTRLVDSHLHYLHRDTEQLCRQLLSSPVLQRWNSADQDIVSKTLEQIRDRHATTLERLVDLKLESDEKNDILRVRYSIQLLCDHYVKLYKNKDAGAITTIENASDLLDPAISQAQQVCESHWMMAPEVHLQRANPSKPLTLVLPWVHHTLVELLKNTFHATLQRHSRDPPPVQITLSSDDDAVCVTLQDHGIGLPDSGNLFAWGYSSAGRRWDRLDEQQSYAAVRSPMSSLGVGLSASRLMMQHFGGNVTLSSSQDEGAVARIYLPFRDDVLEQLPVD